VAAAGSAVGSAAEAAAVAAAGAAGGALIALPAQLSRSYRSHTSRLLNLKDLPATDIFCTLDN